MERSAGDTGGGGALVPSSGAVVPTGSQPMTAGATPTPMSVDEGFFTQPVQAYFQFVQNNLTYINEGNIDAFRQEAEERHTQLMEQKVQQLYQEFEGICLSEIAQQRAEAERRHEHLVSEYAVSQKATEHEVAKLRQELSDANARLKNTTNSVALEAEQRANQKVAHVTAQYEQRFSELKGSLEADCKRIVDETVEHARIGMDGFRKEERAAVQEIREECSRQENQAAELNYQLQGQVEDLMEKLNKYSAPEIKIDEVTENDDGQGGITLDMYMTPKSAVGTKAGVEPRPTSGMDSLALDAKERLSNLFGSTPAGSAAPPKLPTLPVQSRNQEEANHVPSVASPTLVASEDGKKAADAGLGLSGQQLVDLITRLTSKDADGEKPRTKEAETIKLNDMPAPEAYRHWRNHVRDEVKSCSDKPDEAWLWLNEVFDNKASREELEKKLQEPGKFITLDTKLSAALTRSAKGDLATKIHNFKDEKSKKGIQVRGRRVLLMFEDHFRTSEEAGSLYRVEDLLGVVRNGESVEDLRRFLNRWDATIAGMETPPDDLVLRDILLRQIRKCHLMKYDIEAFDRAPEKSEQKSYAFLLRNIRDLLDRERLRSNRNRIVEKNKQTDKPQPAAPAQGGKDRGKGKGDRGRSRGRSQSTKGDRICYKFRDGKCEKGKDCPYKHVRESSRSGTPKKKGKGKGNKSSSPTRKSKEEMAKTPCTYFQQGKCRRGDKCFYKHEVAAAPAKDPKRTNSPAPKKKASAKAAPCIVQRYACIAKTKGLPKVTKAMKDQSHRAVVFSSKVEYIKVPATGEQHKVVHRPRIYEKTFPDSESVPKPDKLVAHRAQVSARQLQELVKLFGSGAEPKCRFRCNDEEGGTSCNHCRALIGPKNKISNTHLPTVATPASKDGGVWLVDTGSEQDLISEGMLKTAKATNRRVSDTPICLSTANGSTRASEVADIKVDALHQPFSPYILEETPAVLSVGVRCMEQGYSFVWPADGRPYFIRPDMGVIELNVDGRVPVIDSSCRVLNSGQFKKDCDLLRLFAMVAAKAEAAEEEGVDEGVAHDSETEYIRSRKAADLEQEACSKSHQFCHYPKNPFCKICQKARMMAPPARKKGGQKRLETKSFGDHIVADHTVIKSNVEEGSKGETVALVMKDIHTQFRHVYPSQTKSTDSCVNAFNHFLSHKDEVGAVYTDNSRELIATISELGYRHQTSTEYVDSSKSFVEREIRHMLEGTRTNLVQAGLPLQYWPLAMQHFSTAVNATPQLNGDDAPWKLRFEEDFPGLLIPFGAKILFWNNPKRVDNTSGKTSPTANDGIFLGYHIQPGFAWKGEYLVAKMEALDYHAENGSITVQRARRVELTGDSFVFPLRALKEAKEPKPDRLADNVIAEPRPIPFQSELQAEESAEAVDKSSEAVPDALAIADEPVEEPIFPDIKYTPTGKPIPDGYHWDGTRLVKTYKGSKRPESIPSDLWKMLSPKDRQKLIEEEAEKMAVGSGEAASSSSSKGPKKKKAAVATARKLRVNPSPSGEPVVAQWEVIPEDRPKFCVPAMPKAAPAKAELHRPELRQLIKDKIAELEFKVALELFSAVARLVPKDEVRKNPKAKAALDKEWENLRSKGVWDESRVKECKSIVDEARKNGETVHLGRIFEACYEKGSELPPDDPRRKFKGRTVFQGNNVRDQDSDHALFAELGSSPASMEAAKLLDAFGSQPGFSKAQADAIQAYIQALFTGVPTWLTLPRNRWPEQWEKEFWQPMVPLVLALYGHPDSGGIWENHLNSRINKEGWKQILPDVWQSIFYHAEYNCMLVVYVDDFKLAGPTENMDKAWASIKRAVNIDNPEPYDRYFGCQHVEFNNITLPRQAHPFAHVFDSQAAAAARTQHRTNDFWQHDPVNQTWTRYHLQPRKKLFEPGDEGGEFAKSLRSERVTMFDKSVEFKGLPVLNMHMSDENSAIVEDDMTIDQKIQTKDFWTGRTIFRYGDESGNTNQFALPSKNRPGPHRDKREAKNEKKSQRFKSIENVVDNKSGCMTKPVNLVRYDMSSFMESCVDAYCELAKVQKADLPVVATPFTEAGIARPTLDEKEKPGRLQPIASKVLMKILFAARMARPDLLRATQSLASRVTKWSIECDIALHRLVSYIKSTTDVYMEGFVGDSFDDCQLWLFADADHAGEHDSKSTSGCAMFLVGPNTYFPLNAFSKKQTVVANSSTEAEVVSANHALRAEGIPMLALLEQLGIFKKMSQKAGAKPTPNTLEQNDPVFTRIDKEIDEIRYGNVEGGLSAANINGLKAHFPEFYQVKFMEDNQASITVMGTGNSSTMRYANKTQNICFKWMKQLFEDEQFDLINVGTLWQTADILTKPFTSPSKWEHALRLMAIGKSWVEADKTKVRSVDSKPACPANANDQGGDNGSNSFQRLLIEFCCSSDSKLCTPRQASKGCRLIRVTEHEDGTTQGCRKWLAQEVQSFRESNPEGEILLYASLPCVGGSPWGYINGLTEKGAERIEQQQKDFTKLFKSLQKVIHEIDGPHFSIAFELSKNCKYWKWPMVQSFLKKQELKLYPFHGCQFGVVDSNGNPMKKGWTIATNMDELSSLSEYVCDGSHTHGQSRGEALKLAENYTFTLTDFIHECFRSRADQAQTAKTRKRLALPAMSRRSDEKMSIADKMNVRALKSAGLKTVPQQSNMSEWLAFRKCLDVEGDRHAGWEDIFSTVLASSTILASGNRVEDLEIAAGFMQCYTAQSMATDALTQVPWATELLHLSELESDSLWDLKLPTEYVPGTSRPAVDVVPTIYVVTSDSTLALITGKGRTLKKYTMKEDLAARKSDMVLEIGHDMLWGKDLQQLCKANVAMVKDLMSKYKDHGSAIRVISVIVWSGNEICGEHGVEPLQAWGQRDPQGDWNAIMDRVKGNLVWWNQQLKDLGVDQAALVSAPDPLVYGLSLIFTTFMDRLKTWFAEEILGGENGNERLRWIDNDRLPARLELRDQFHAFETELNRSEMVGYMMAMLHCLHMTDIVTPQFQQSLHKRKRPAGEATMRDHMPRMEHLPVKFVQVLTSLREKTNRSMPSVSVAEKITAEELRAFPSEAGQPDDEDDEGNPWDALDMDEFEGPSVGKAKASHVRLLTQLPKHPHQLKRWILRRPPQLARHPWKTS